MKKIVAVIKPYRLDEVQEVLSNIGAVGMTISEVKGYGRQQGHNELYRGAEYVVDYIPKAKVEIVVDESRVSAIVDAIRKVAHSGKIGDGKIFISNIEQAIRVRTGEVDKEAL
ncbi:MAG TPA: P-II family nitrogen regulator [Nitratifractor sp.]|nr:P-II family nitrogen regulator [Nitratifractor sp.]HHH20431.1 P-II family nitrogen regulator [Nitratifractor sp.]